MSSIISREQVRESEIVKSPLSEEKLKIIVRNWKNLISSCFGPYGNTVMVQNTLGGTVTVTNSSSHLLEKVQSSHYILKLISSVIKSHCMVWKDFGLFSMMVILHILEAIITSDLSPSKVAFVLEHFVDLIVEHLSSDCTLCKFKVDVTRLSHLNAVIKTSLQSKLLSSFSQIEIKYLTTICLQGFLAAIPTNPDVSEFGEINIISCDGLSVVNSKFFSGYLYCIADKQISSSNVYTAGKVALFDISLAGDYENEILKYEHETYEDFSFEDVIIPSLLKIIEQLVKLHVTVVVCQKVVHPTIQKALRKNKILCMERLGLEGFRQFNKLSHGIPISSVFDDVNPDCLGEAKEINCIDICGKSYLQVKNDDNGGTIVLCHFNEELLQQLKVVCKQALSIARTLLSNSEVFVGSGCLEAHLIVILQNMISEGHSENIIGISKGQVQEIFQILINSLKDVIKRLHPVEDNLCFDANSGHLFIAPENLQCCCGLTLSSNVDLVPFQLISTLRKTTVPKTDDQLILENIDNSVLDIGIAKRAAYQNIFEVLCTILKVELCIIDKN